MKACSVCLRVTATLRVIGSLRVCPLCEAVTEEAEASVRLDREETHIHDPRKEEK